MYECYWELRERPFAAFSSEHQCCSLPSQQALLSKIRYCLLDQPGWGVLQGLSGVGKSKLLQRLTFSAQERNFQLVACAGSMACLDRLLHDFQRQFIDRDHRVDAVNEQTILHGLQRNRADRILLIDDAQLLTDAKLLPFLKTLFEALNRFDELGGSFSVLLANSISLDRQQQELLPGNSSAAVRFLMPPLSWKETELYLQQRLQWAGANRFLFDKTAVDHIFRLTGGVCSQINSLADLSLLAGYVQQVAIVSEQQVIQAADELLFKAA